MAWENRKNTFHDEAPATSVFGCMTEGRGAALPRKQVESFGPQILKHRSGSLLPSTVLLKTA